MERISRLDVEGVTFGYPGTDHVVLHDVHLHVEPGEVIANAWARTAVARARWSS